MMTQIEAGGKMKKTRAQEKRIEMKERKRIFRREKGKGHFQRKGEQNRTTKAQISWLKIPRTDQPWIKHEHF